jgi:hypothetical protein
MELVGDAAAANASDGKCAGAANAGAAGGAQVQKQVSPEVPLDPIAQEVQPESMAKEKAPAATVDMAALVATLRTMQHGIEHAMQGAVQSMEGRVTREQRMVFAKVAALRPCRWAWDSRSWQTMPMNHIS